MFIIWQVQFQIGVTIRLFVDDCILYKEILSLEDHKNIQDSISAIFARCYLRGTKWNSEKVVPYVYNYQTIHQHILIHLTALQFKKYKYLSVSLTIKLNRSTNLTSAHWVYVSYGFWNLKNAPEHTKFLACTAHVRSKLECRVCLGPAFIKKEVKQLGHVNRNAMRLISGKHRKEGSPSLLMVCYN